MGTLVRASARGGRRLAGDLLVGSHDLEPADVGRVGDEAFTAVLRAEHDTFVRVAYSILRNEDDVNDVLADAVAKTYAQWRRGRVDDLPRYLTRTVKNTAIARTRKRRTQLKALELLAASTATAGGSDENRYVGYDKAALDEAFAALSDDCRTVIRLRIIEEVPVREVAAQLYVSEGTVKSRCSRCLKQLGRTLGT